MELEQVLAAGWTEHDADPTGVAARLEAALPLVRDPVQAARYTALVNHVVGGELGEWERAMHLDRTAIAAVERGPGLAPALENLAFAAYMSSDVARAMSAEVRAAAYAPAEVVPVLVRVNLLVAEALMHKERWEESLELFHDTLALAETLQASSSADRTVAIVCNNVSSAMLEMPGRSEEQDALMERGARAARTFWLRTGDWKNDERSDYLLALVLHARGKLEEALACAERGLATIATAGGAAGAAAGGTAAEPVDAAFLSVAAAAALRGLGRTAESEARLAAAAGATFGDERWRRRLDDEIAKVRGAG